MSAPNICMFAAAGELRDTIFPYTQVYLLQYLTLRQSLMTVKLLKKEKLSDKGSRVYKRTPYSCYRLGLKKPASTLLP